MQHARDTFYIMLRDRLALVNPERTLVLRGVSRPGLLVAENEMPSAQVRKDAFTLQWTALRVEAQDNLPLVTMECEIRYVTDGTAGSGGMDRGQLMGAMDAELLTALLTAPMNAVKVDYGTVPTTSLGTAVFWSEPKFKAATARAERLERTATVEVWCYAEAGEM